MSGEEKRLKLEMLWGAVGAQVTAWKRAPEEVPRPARSPLPLFPGEPPSSQDAPGWSPINRPKLRIGKIITGSALL